MKHSAKPYLQGRINRRFFATCLFVMMFGAMATPALAVAQGRTGREAPSGHEDIGWTSGFHAPGMNNTVQALATGPDGSLYAGGVFTLAGGTGVNYIARWDGSRWHALGSGVSGGWNRDVYALAFGPDGSLYAAGSFEQAGGIVANHVARWDGSQWHPLGGGLGGTVYAPVAYALAVGQDGSLYVGGGFDLAGGVAANNIARWDPATSSWHSLSTGVNSGVFALAVGPDGSLYAGGYFTAAGGAPALNIARWDGSQWHPLGSGIAYDVEALTVGPDGTLYAGGYFATAGGVPANGIAAWDGSQWHALGSGISGQNNPSVRAMAIGLDGSLYVGGQFAGAGGIAANCTARWDGAQWHALDGGMGAGTYPSVEAMAMGTDGSIIAGGQFTAAGDVGTNYIAKWNGSDWRPVGLGNGVNGTVDALTSLSSESFYAAGAFPNADGVIANCIARWEDSQWHPLATGLGNCTTLDIRALELGPDGSLYAGGGFPAAGAVAARNVARWDGTQWHPLGDGTESIVNALAIAPNGVLYAGGWFTRAGGVTVNYVARWDGFQWLPLGSGMDGGVEALAVGPDGWLYAGGYFTTAGGVAANHVARWDGSQWYPLGSGTSETVYALAFDPDGSLVAGGWFGGGVARWDGSQWHVLGSGMDYGVYALAFGPDGSLVAGGHFSSAGGAPAAHIARWDGSQWHPLADGMNDDVRALAFTDGGALIVGGSFTTAGGIPSGGIARWGEVAPTAVSFESFQADHRYAGSYAWAALVALGAALGAGAWLARRGAKSLSER